MSTQLIRSLRTKKSMDDISTSTTRNGNKRRVIHNEDLFIKINTAEPSLKLRSKSITQAVKHWAIHLINTSKNTATIRQLLKLLHRLIPTLAGNDTIGYHTTTAIYKQVRSAIIKKYGATHNITQDSNVLMRVNQRTYKTVMKNYNANVTKKNQGNADVYDAKTVYKKLDECAASDDWRHLAIGVELACGARLNETLSYSTFSESDRDGWIIQHGISKQGRLPRYEKGMTHGDYLKAVESKNADKITQVEKPTVHITPKQLISMVSKLRLALKSDIDKIYDGTQTSTGLAQRLNPRVNKVLKCMLPNTTTHSLRKIYAQLAYKKYGSEMSEVGFISKILGHAKGNLSTAKAYTTVRMSGGSKSNDSDVTEKLNRLCAMVEQLSTVRTSVDALDNIPRNQKIRDGKVSDRMAASIVAMRSKGIEPTVKHLRALGYGSGTISKWKRTQSKK